MEKSARNLAIDTYRGLVMLLMMAEILQLSRVAKALPGSAFWSFLAYHQTHTEWAGCSLHDTIQPGFSFLVGVALPYSIAARIAKGGTFIVGATGAGAVTVGNDANASNNYYNVGGVGASSLASPSNRGCAGSSRAMRPLR